MREPADCWPWTGGKQRRFRYKGTSALAHRVAYELHRGVPLPTGVHLKHTCGDVFCCNARHMHTPGWSPTTCNGRTEFSPEDIDAIRKERAAGVTLQEIRESWGADTRALLLMFRL